MRDNVDILEKYIENLVVKIHENNAINATKIGI